MLDLGVASARAAADKARADLDMIDNNGMKLSDARAKLETGRHKLTSARASVAATITVLQVRRASLEASITAIEAIIAQPGGPPPHVPPYPVLLAAMKDGLTGLKAGIAGAKAGLAKIDANLAKMTKGLRTLDSAIRQLLGAHDLLEINVEAQDIAVRLAQTRRDAATIASPVSGIVTFARVPGTAVMVGAPIVRIRPDGPQRVDTYLTGSELSLVTVGTPVSVDFDSNPGAPLKGRVSVIGDTSVVPPTSFPTAIVHMTRAVRVTIELDPGPTAPPGTPVDIEIRTGNAR
jgi:multidrug resistance efflux pump